MVQEFQNPVLSRNYRQGTKKCNFNYLLIDPRIANVSLKTLQFFLLCDQRRLFTFLYSQHGTFILQLFKAVIVLQYIQLELFIKSLQDLTKLSDSLHPVEVFKLFIKSVFYIGKARQSRPYGHLKEASQMAKVRGRGG